MEVQSACHLQQKEVATTSHAQSIANWQLGQDGASAAQIVEVA
jgi:hypothetical protein